MCAAAHDQANHSQQGKFKAGVKVGSVIIADERDKTIIVDREVKTPTGAFIEGFIRPHNDTESPDKFEGDRPRAGDARFDIEREFEFAQMMSQRR